MARWRELADRFFTFLFSRDGVLFCVGLGGVIHETTAEMGERPSLLVLFAVMMGLPLYLSRNGK